MPNYKTHSIHSSLILPNIDNKVNININDIMDYSIGPDTLAISNYRVFFNQHITKVKRFFSYLINYIKKNKLQDNKQIMAFLYGQIDHYILDIIMHPMIYYYTSNLKSKDLIDNHGLIEHWIDDYAIKKYNKDKNITYIQKIKMNKELIKLIDDIYVEVYDSNHASLHYRIGLNTIFKYDNIVRKKYSHIFKHILDKTHIGNITYGNNYQSIIEFLNPNHEIWYNPETNELYRTSFDDLWKRSIYESSRTIDDVNKYLYQDKPLHNYYLDNDLSYNTGLPCQKGQSLRYSKKY